MHRIVQIFHEAMDRAYPDDPDKWAACARIFNKVCERTLKVSMIEIKQEENQDDTLND